MAPTRLSARLITCLAAACLAAGAGVAAPGTHALAATTNRLLFDVAATSAKSAWAVGFRFNGAANQTLIEHWNGKSWKQVKSPNPGGASGNSELLGVTAISARNAWAVGTYSAGGAQHTLAVHWNGRSWKRVRTPAPGCVPGDQLTSVTATSATSIWAVGFGATCPGQGTVVLHWNGKGWKRVASPNPAGADSTELLGVAATSGRNAWAVGDWSTASTQHTLTEHWNGKSWRIVPSPNMTGQAQNNLLTSVAASARTSTWAVGTSTKPSHATVTVILRWNGKAWTRVPGPRPRNAQDAELTDITVASATSAWVVGSYRDQVKAMDLNLTARWNGRSWRIVRNQSAPPPAHDGGLTGVAALSRTSVWAVGDYSSGSAEHMFIEHWNGTSWRRQV
jgi:hypothetical protein